MFSSSALFVRAAAYCAREYNDWYILDAEYGLLSPDELIQPHHHTTRGMSKVEREAWGTDVSAQLRQLGNHRYYAHAARDAVQALTGVTVVNVLEGLRIGQRLRWYNEQLMCPICVRPVLHEDLSSHIRSTHGDDGLRQAVLSAREEGMSEAAIGSRYRVSSRKLEQIFTDAYGANVSAPTTPKRIRHWEPAGFRPETTSVWSFKQRGNWATHDGGYRGNWSPYIPRNIILKYSRPGEIVLDYFAGGGTTAVEAKLLGRRSIARDINPDAVRIALENLKFEPPLGALADEADDLYEPEVEVGDARDLSNIEDSSIDLICAHPPYAGIIKYSTGIPGDMSSLLLNDFLSETKKVALESLRVLKPGKKCAILIGDSRQSRHVVPIGFQTIKVFLDAGFILRELVMKRQHNCKTTGFWYTRSVQYNFLLLAHEYLPVFEKPKHEHIREQQTLWDQPLAHRSRQHAVSEPKGDQVETTTVWLLPPSSLEQEIRSNLVSRFARPGTKMAEVVVDQRRSSQHLRPKSRVSLIYVRPGGQPRGGAAAHAYRYAVKTIADEASRILSADDFLVVEAMDVRNDGHLEPMALLVYEELCGLESYAINEIVVVVPKASEPDNLPSQDSASSLRIVHKYLLVYRRTAS